MRWLAVSVVLVVTVGCANVGPASVDRSPAVTTVAERAPKTITLGQLNPVKAYAPWDFGDTTGGGPLLVEIHTSSLVSQDARGNRESRLAARLPSFEDGSISLQADGRMRVAWTLRPGITWHDGAPFTADDLRFSWDVLSHPEIPAGGSQTSGSQTTVVRLVESVEAPDPLTFVVVWKRPFYQALDMGVRNWWPFPRRLLGEAFGSEKQAFMAQPFFTSEYVHLGPFRLVEFQAGELQVFRRFDSYMLGAARLDSISIRTIRDPNALFASFRAGAIDIVGERALPSQLFIQLRNEWSESAPPEGVVVQRQYNWRNLQIQHGQQWARPPELAQDVRARRGLLRVMDRPAMEEFVYPGFNDVSGDTYMLKDDPRLA
ncbi:MAG: 4-phytase, partial [Chloroflexi bacterium]|nr:4-phytase [Chloroflexota bacterium]